MDPLLLAIWTPKCAEKRHLYTTCMHKQQIQLSLVHNIDATQRKLDARIEFRFILVSKVGDPIPTKVSLNYCKPAFSL